MTQYDQNQAECFVFTYKEGLLSAVAHDLKLKVGTFTIDVDRDAASISAVFQVKSIDVVEAQRNGRDAPGVLSADDKRKIVQNLQKDVIKVRRNPEIKFEATGVELGEGNSTLAGDLTIAGRTRQVRLPVTRDGDRYTIDYRFNQKDFGIRPFSAMMGTIKIKPELRVTVSIPAE